MSDRATPTDRLTSYQRRLFVFLGVATFFEGYDFMALTQILPELREEMGLDTAEGGLLVGVINAGTVIAYVLIRKADRWGRKRVLTITIAGYTVFTGLSGLAPDVWVFGGLQLVARVFLIAEWATSMVIAAEEFPASKRGMVIGVIQAMTSLGAIVCAGVVPLLLETAYGWRTVYFLGVLPLVILAFARRNLKETQKFTDQVGTGREARSFFAIWSGPHRKRLLQMGLIWFTTYLCTTNGVTFFKEFVVAERGFSDGDVGLAISIASVGAMPLVFYSGKLLDQVGRRPGAAIIFGLGAAGVFLAYTLHGLWPLTAALVLGILGAAGTMPVLNTYTTELFPTDCRADAFAWSNNILGRAGYVVSPIVIGQLQEVVGAWGPVVRTTAIFPLLAVVLIYAMLPETMNRELEETSALH